MITWNVVAVSSRPTICVSGLWGQTFSNAVSDSASLPYRVSWRSSRIRDPSSWNPRVPI